MTGSLRIAMIGCRGVPASYGGIERHVEEVGARLVERGHEVTVYCRPGYTPGLAAEYRGMRRVTLPAIATKHLEAMSHSAVAAGIAVLGRHDIFHFHALGPGLMTPLTRLSPRGSAVLTVHGLDFGRAKWGRAAAAVIRQSERVAARWSHAVVVVAPDLVEHYRTRYGIEATYIRNGVNRPPVPSDVAPGRYVLFVGRLTPEKKPDLLVEAFRRLDDPGLRLVVVGGSSHTDGYVDRLRQLARADPRVSLRGYVYGDELAGLYAGARLFVQPSCLEGMPLTVLEAASYGVPLLTSDIPVHQALLGRPAAGRWLFRSESVDDLGTQLGAALSADEEAERRASSAFGDDVLERYSWEDVVDELEELYRRTRRPAEARHPAQLRIPAQLRLPVQRRPPDRPRETVLR
jgi:glycosyltransferase involved in cell wall biosynthesis